jgi:hypothetical protein
MTNRALLLALLAGMAKTDERIARIEAAIARLSMVPGSGARDAAEEDVLRAIAERVGPETFFCQDIISAAVIDPVGGISRALGDACVDVQSPRAALELGKLLSRLHAAGLVDRETKPGRRGVRWCFNHARLRGSTSQPHTLSGSRR